MSKSQAVASPAKLCARDCADLLRRLSPPNLSAVARLKARLRPFTCPFEVLIDFVPDNSRVLDIGCGAGYFLAMLAAFRQGISGVGFDINPLAVEEAKTLAGRLATSGFASDLSFFTVSDFDGWPSSTFDVVTVIDAVHHVSPLIQTEFLLQAAARVRPGGLLVYKDMCIRPLWRRAANRLHDIVLSGDWVHEIAPEAVESLIADAGFECARRSRINRFCYGHDVRLFRHSVTHFKP